MRIIRVLFLVYSLLFIAYCQAAPEEEFIYDALGKLDPFIPLIDNAAATGLREDFRPPEQVVRLPVEVMVKGVLWNGREYFAIVNDQVMKTGDLIDNKVKIKEIKSDRLILEYGKKEFTILLRKEKEG
ncbi:MAG: general secretion pathway protein GspB [Candidatus Omnitrophica bacterium]|nr:general secretion pathway protein GspB [Candidatus Omnitrophota bacterium]